MKDKPMEPIEPSILIYADGSVQYAGGLNFSDALAMLYLAYLYEEERFRKYCKQNMKEVERSAENR